MILNSMFQKKTLPDGAFFITPRFGIISQSWDMVETGREKKRNRRGKTAKISGAEICGKCGPQNHPETKKNPVDMEKMGSYTGKCGKMREGRKMRGNAIMRIYIRRNEDRVIPHPGLNGG